MKSAIIAVLIFNLLVVVALDCRLVYRLGRSVARRREMRRVAIRRLTPVKCSSSELGLSDAVPAVLTRTKGE